MKLEPGLELTHSTMARLLADLFFLLVPHALHFHGGKASTEKG